MSAAGAARSEKGEGLTQTLCSLADRAGEVALVVSSDGRIQAANQCALEAYQYTLESLREKFLPDLEVRPGVHRRADGVLFAMQGQTTALENGNALYLGKAQPGASLPFAVTPEAGRAGVGAWEWDKATGFAFWDAKMRRLHDGAAWDDAGDTLESWQEQVAVRDRRTFDGVMTALQTGEEAHGAYRVAAAHGERWIAFGGRSEDDGRTVRGIAYDVAQACRSLEALERSRDLLEIAAEAARSLVYEFDMVHGVVHRLCGFERLTGWRPEDAPATSSWWREQIHPDDLAHAVDDFDRQIENRRTDRVVSEYRIRRRDGSWRWVRDAAMVFRDNSGAAVRMVGSTVDIQAQRDVEDALRASEERLRAVVETAPGLLFAADRDGRLTSISPRFAEYTGLPFAESDGGRWVLAVHPADRGRFLRVLRKAVRRGESFEADCRLRRSDGAYRWFVARGRPVEGAGAATQWYGIAADIDDWKRAETELRRSNDSLQQFFFAASHDFQEPLRIITVFTQLLAQRRLTALDEGDVDCMRVIVDAATRLSAMVGDLLTYARVATERPATERVDLGRLLAEAMVEMEPAFRDAQATVEGDLLPTVPGDAFQLAQLVRHLLSNALKYRRPDTALRIRLQARLREQHWVIGFGDNGQGFRQQYADRIFGMFRRLHGRTAPGTGMGLTLCRRVVELHGGEMWAEGKPGEGATFWFTLEAR